jgi:hypothetical protein
MMGRQRSPRHQLPAFSTKFYKHFVNFDYTANLFIKKVFFLLQQNFIGGKIPLSKKPYLEKF